MHNKHIKTYVNKKLGFHIELSALNSLLLLFIIFMIVFAPDWYFEILRVGFGDNVTY